MKVCEAWLREWVNPSLTGQQLASQLTMAGLEVDSLSPVAGAFNHVIVAHVLNTTPHPQADRLTLCEIDSGAQTPIQVVCGATNVRAGLKVALALPGAHLPGGFEIKESKLRGELSQGMLCSVSELGMDERSDGIIELPDDAPVGADLRDYLMLNGQVFDIDLTPNRADCLSVLGIAREVGALNQLPIQALPNATVEATIADKPVVHIKAPAACPQYGARIIRGINAHANTPIWMKERLRRSGVRVVHPVVDVLNYVMLELGQPMHAFDLHAIEGDIQVRFSTPTETLVLLDGREVALHDEVLVIADDNTPLAIAGVMGGQASAVHENTCDILLESAFFNPLVIAGVARHYGVASDSSQRYERGVDPSIQAMALDRATDLLLAIVGGNAGPITMLSQHEHLPARDDVLFNPSSVQRLTGLTISNADMVLMLQGLGMTVAQAADVWTVSIPAHRFDLALEVDLVEEIVRLYGYDNIVGTPVTASLQIGTINPIERLSMHMSTFLNNRGYNESISYSFVDPQFQSVIYPDAQTMDLLNPISSELSQMRVGLWPGLLAAVVYNMHRQQTAIKLFESGVVFDIENDSLRERATLAGVMTGQQGILNWSESARKYDFFDMKGDVQALCASLNLSNVHFVSAAHPALHPGQSARILVDGKEAGWMGVLHPRLLDALDLTCEVVLFELSLPALCHEHLICYQPISKYPQIRRDLSLLVDVSVTAGEIEQVVRSVVSASLLKSFDVFDVYTGESIAPDKKSMAIALTLQDDKRTLIDTEINALISAILKKLDDDFGIILREANSNMS